MSINSNDTSISKSKQLEVAIPASSIATLSSGEFVGLVADNPDCVIKRKIFHSKIEPLKNSNFPRNNYLSGMPECTPELKKNYYEIKAQVLKIIGS